MALHHPNQVRVGRSLELVLGDFLDAIDQASTISAGENGLRVRSTEPEVGNDIGFR